MKAASKPDGLSIPRLIKSPSALLILIFLISRCICISIHLGPAHHSLVTIFSDFPLRYFANVTLWSRSFPAASLVSDLCNVAICTASWRVQLQRIPVQNLHPHQNGILMRNEMAYLQSICQEIQWTHVISFCQLLHTWWCYPAYAQIINAWIMNIHIDTDIMSSCPDVGNYLVSHVWMGEKLWAVPRYPLLSIHETRCFWHGEAQLLDTVLMSTLLQQCCCEKVRRMRRWLSFSFTNWKIK